MLRRLHPNQPTSFAFSPENQKWAEAQLTKYPEGRQASAIIPLLWRAQEQEGWLSRPAIEFVADMLGMAHIRALEVATFYFMFQLQPVGSAAHIQVCGTLSCMLCGAEDLVSICKEKFHQLLTRCRKMENYRGKKLNVWEHVPMLQWLKLAKTITKTFQVVGLRNCLSSLEAGMLLFLDRKMVVFLLSHRLV